MPPNAPHPATSQHPQHPRSPWQFAQPPGRAISSQRDRERDAAAIWMSGSVTLLAARMPHLSAAITALIVPERHDAAARRRRDLVGHVVRGCGRIRAAAAAAGAGAVPSLFAVLCCSLPCLGHDIAMLDDDTQHGLRSALGRPGPRASQPARQPDSQTTARRLLIANGPASAPRPASQSQKPEQEPGHPQQRFSPPVTHHSPSPAFQNTEPAPWSPSRLIRLARSSLVASLRSRLVPTASLFLARAKGKSRAWAESTPTLRLRHFCPTSPERQASRPQADDLPSTEHHHEPRNTWSSPSPG
ncbi:hypothetical protein BS50DRAFT_84590 [Corynespora cassiicola Philippines]|uniref:Uncharacterized protein n=1 Tax=Corynespora cassiicola Philippines TaxID=1448308 RepID=A0A2T2NEC6_CORCC|nr:hypothetical protein BS50DRAFT_84590 [Corynespora cassiicola Philippines]